MTKNAKRVCPSWKRKSRKSTLSICLFFLTRNTRRRSYVRFRSVEMLLKRCPWCEVGQIVLKKIKKSFEKRKKIKSKKPSKIPKHHWKVKNEYKKIKNIIKMKTPQKLQKNSWNPPISWYSFQKRWRSSWTGIGSRRMTLRLQWSWDHGKLWGGLKLHVQHLHPRPRTRQAGATPAPGERQRWGRRRKCKRNKTWIRHFNSIPNKVENNIKKKKKKLRGKCNSNHYKHIRKKKFRKILELSWNDEFTS